MGNGLADGCIRPGPRDASGLGDASRLRDQRRRGAQVSCGRRPAGRGRGKDAGPETGTNVRSVSIFCLSVCGCLGARAADSLVVDCSPLSCLMLNAQDLTPCRYIRTMRNQPPLRYASERLQLTLCGSLRKGRVPRRIGADEAGTIFRFAAGGARMRRWTPMLGDRRRWSR